MDDQPSLTSILSTRTFGVTLGTTILQNGLKSRLPAAFLAQFPSSTEISYAIIPLIPSLPDPVLRAQVKEAFASSISIIWLWVVGIAGLGLLATLPMKQMTLATSLDENWGLERTGTANVRGSSDLEATGSVEKVASELGGKL